MNWNDFPWMTFFAVVVGIIVVIVGGVACIKGDITFEAYLKALAAFLVGAGLTAVGRGIRLHGTPRRP